MKKATLILIAITIAIANIGCTPEGFVRKQPLNGYKSYHFSIGQIVEMKLDNRKGMITCMNRTYDKKNVYKVRFSGDQLKTNTRTVSEDKPTAKIPYALITVYEYEIREVTK